MLGFTNEYQIAFHLFYVGRVLEVESIITMKVVTFGFQLTCILMFRIFSIRKCTKPILKSQKFPEEVCHVRILRDDMCVFTGRPIFFITNALKCLPPANSPNGIELNKCSVHLKNELHAMTNIKAVIALGMHAHNSVLKCYDYRMSDYKFQHGNVHKLREFMLYDSYHCSRINIQTKRLTKESLCDILRHVRENITNG